MVFKKLLCLSYGMLYAVLLLILWYNMHLRGVAKLWNQLLKMKLEINFW